MAFSVWVLAQWSECNLSDASSSPLQKWRENIDILNNAIRQEATKVTCDAGAARSEMADYIARVVPLDSSVSLMREIYSLSSTGADFFSEVDSFLDQSGPVMELKSHLWLIEDVERSIIETAQFTWSHCAQSLKITTNILGEKSGYDTRWRTYSEVLVDMAKQTKEVKRFFQILSQWIQTEEYIDEVPFLIATPGFSRDMYMYYSPKYIQECRDNDPRKWAFMEVLKWAFTSGWKYPQAIKVWKDAMALLLYRGSQLVGAGSTDADKESQIQSIIQARKWGIGNSDIAINSQFFKEFWYRPNSKTVDEKTDTQEKKAFYESMGYEFMRKVIPSILRQGGTDGTGYVKNNQTKEETEKVQRLQDVEEMLYTLYGARREEVALNKEKDSKIPTELVQTIQGSKESQKHLKEAWKNYCATLGKQATNISGAWRCK